MKNQDIIILFNPIFLTFNIAEDTQEGKIPRQKI